MAGDGRVALVTINDSAPADMQVAIIEAVLGDRCRTCLEPGGDWCYHACPVVTQRSHR